MYCLSLNNERVGYYSFKILQFPQVTMYFKVPFKFNAFNLDITLLNNFNLNILQYILVLNVDMNLSIFSPPNDRRASSP